MSHPDEFDAFYKDARTRLLLQTYALTGDLPASRSAVRDSFVHAWHHWRKVSRLEDPEAWVRPHAFGHAQRRHTARIWHRDKGLDDEARATLEALAKLPTAQRKALLLTALSTATMEAISREVGLPRPETERLLQTATAQFAVQRDVATTSVRPLLEALRSSVEDVTWPRPTILRRAGTARRRTHTLIGVVATVAAVGISGAVATDLSGSRPTLARAGAEAASTDTEDPLPPPPSSEFSGDALLSAEQLDVHAPGRNWSVSETSDNSAGDGLVMPCQRARYADPRGRAALVREFRSDGKPALAAWQSAEVSASAKAAQRAFERSVEWFGGCVDPRVQLRSTGRVRGVGDDARLLVLTSWQRPAHSIIVGLARTGRLTSTLVIATDDVDVPAVGGPSAVLAAAVDSLCARAGGGSCAEDPEVADTAPVPVAAAPGMLAEVDLPPVTRVMKPWVGTEPRKALDNVAATGCDSADFAAKPMTNNLTRTFLIPGADLPASFGLTETVGTMPRPGATRFVDRIRDRLASCPEKDLGSDVARLAHKSSAGADLTVWRVRTQLGPRQSITYLMGIVRRGTALAQVGFVPGPRATVTDAAFVALVRRAADRLPAMPPPD